MKFGIPLTLAAALLVAAPEAQAGGQVEVGSKASHTFSTAPVNSMGVKSLKDLRGKPVLVEFWGTR